MKSTSRGGVGESGFFLLLLLLLTLSNFVVGPLGAPDWVLVALILVGTAWLLWLVFASLGNRSEDNRHLLLLAVPLGLFAVNADRLDAPTWAQLVILGAVVAWGASMVLLHRRHKLYRR